MVDGGHDVAVGGEFLGPGGVLGAHTTEPGGEEHHREGAAVLRHRSAGHRVGPGARQSVEQEPGYARVVGQRRRDSARLRLGPPEIRARRASPCPRPAGYQSCTTSGRAPFSPSARERFSTRYVSFPGPGPPRARTTPASACPPGNARRPGEVRHRKRPRRHRPRDDERHAHRRPRQRRPPRGPPRRPAGAPCPPPGECERPRDGGRAHHRRELPARPRQGEHGHRAHEQRPEPSAAGPRHRRGSQRARTRTRAPSTVRASGADSVAPVDTVIRPSSDPVTARHIALTSRPCAT